MDLILQLQKLLRNWTIGELLEKKRKTKPNQVDLQADDDSHGEEQQEEEEEEEEGEEGEKEQEGGGKDTDSDNPFA